MRLICRIMGVGVIIACTAGCAKLIDRWPTLPDSVAYCETAEESRKQAPAPAPGKRETVAVQHSIHRPYLEKRCNNCHDEEKKTLSGLVKPKEELCLSCHPSIVKHAWAHGPTAQGECLSCHLPHEASQPFLLVSDRATLCQKCHAEPRVAGAMHVTVTSQGIACPDCHDPHSGVAHSLLK